MIEEREREEAWLRQMVPIRNTVIHASHERILISPDHHRHRRQHEKVPSTVKVRSGTYRPSHLNLRVPYIHHLPSISLHRSIPMIGANSTDRLLLLSAAKRDRPLKPAVLLLLSLMQHAVGGRQQHTLDLVRL